MTGHILRHGFAIAAVAVVAGGTATPAPAQTAPGTPLGPPDTIHLGMAQAISRALDANPGLMAASQSARSADRTAAASFREHFGDVEAVAWDRAEVEAASEGASLLVNTTSIGLGEVPGAFPFELRGHGLAMDAVYRPDGKTPFVTAARHGGRRAVDGLPMLVAQGAASFRFWHGEKPDWHEALHWLEERLGRGHHAIAREHAA